MYFFKNGLWWIAGVVLFASLSSCGEIKRPSKGNLGEIIIVMDSTKWDSELAYAVKEVFADYMETLPQPEPKYDLTFMTIRKPSDIDFVKRRRNVVFCATLDEDSNVAKLVRSLLSEPILDRIKTGQNFAIPVENKWALNQYAMFLVGNNDEELARKILTSDRNLLRRIDELEIERWKNVVYERGEQTELADSLMQKHGFSFRIQHDYDWGADTTNFVAFRRLLSDNYRWIWVHWIDSVYNVSHVDSTWVNRKRDSLLKIYMRGNRSDSSYITTEYRRPVEHDIITMNGRYTIETRGTWRMVGDFMGGPFVNYTMYDENQRRLYMMEFVQFAPKYKKRRFVRQFDAMARTFETGEIPKPDISN